VAGENSAVSQRCELLQAEIVVVKKAIATGDLSLDKLTYPIRTCEYPGAKSYWSCSQSSIQLKYAWRP
jgi:hypothetical protein